jgi:menaquinol-cytochrome c reductase cytochrome b/c subunit
VLGALAGAPTEIELATSPQFQEGKEITASSGCLGCHKIGENGNTLGPPLTNIGDRLGPDAIARTLVNPTSPMPSFRTLQKQNPEQFDKLVQYVASLKSEQN